MADINYSRGFSHVDWIDNEDVVQAGGENGFNKKFRDLEAEFDKIAAAVSAIKDALGSVQELADAVVTTPKLADNAVTAKKISANAVTTEKLALNAVGTNQIQNGAIDGSKLAPNSISFASIAPGAITRDKIAFFQVNSGSGVVQPNGGVFITTVQNNVENAQAILYLPMMTIVSTSGTGVSDVEPAIVYQGRATSNLVDVMIRITNRGNAQASFVWAVNSITTAFVG